MTKYLQSQVEEILATKQHPLDQIYGFLDAHMDMRDEYKVACTLFAAHTHAIQRLDMTAYLHISAPTHESGKTRLADIMECICARAEQVSFATPSAMKRLGSPDLQARKFSGPPTFIMDEVDTTLKKDEHLIGYMNQGFTRGHSVPLGCPDEKKGWKIVRVDPFAPKILIGIGELPAKALASRCIPIRLVRRDAASGRLPRFGERQKPKLAPIVGHLSEWAENVELLNPDILPDDFYPDSLGDRQQDMWESLLLMAQAAGPKWLKKAQEAAVLIHKRNGRAYDTTETLLRDIHTIFDDKGVGQISTDELIRTLSTEEFEWGTYVHNGNMFWQWDPEHENFRAGIIVAQILKPFGIRAMHIRPDGVNQVRGFKRESFQNLWLKYDV